MRLTTVIALFSLLFVRLSVAEALAAEEGSHAKQIACKYVDDEAILETAPSADSPLIVMLYDSHGHKVGTDFLARDGSTTTFPLLYSRLPDTYRATNATCYEVAGGEQPGDTPWMYDCRPETWLKVEQGVDAKIREAALVEDSVFIEMDLAYVSALWGLPKPGVQILGLKVDDGTIYWYPKSAQEKDLLVLVQGMQKGPHTIEVGNRDPIPRPPLNLDGRPDYHMDQSPKLFPTDALCVTL